ncbi:putative GTPase MTG1 NDAI_0G04560 [Naumovozyma dairenensis CBS 421]|uniref:G domain-containing protein n=1 Tax=Naumovozyma dairenensis (strain ATCC 10597 / BCRC 20456 / CBS 421 / NBRC 0211 / NRRL Y-12639) TaxID=1071378 RepID=J7S4G6_NAUDC|nr:hypothetical protein NDAI_0G04560 [Naumovozyma dairenensis CBS 421]CCK73441.1 hypothetical protein NDAI_0G04560 [Naumovozyma dairenensis CBS 421]
MNYVTKLQHFLPKTIAFSYRQRWLSQLVNIQTVSPSDSNLKANNTNNNNNNNNIKQPFVPRYEFPQYNITLTDFKGHQMKALKNFQKLLPQLNMIIELRDIRAPLSTRNLLFDTLLSRTKKSSTLSKLIIYTKKDLLSSSPQDPKKYLDKLIKWHNEINEKFIIMNCNHNKDIKTLMDLINWQNNKFIKNPLPMGFRILIIGMPNVGKSTLTNSLRSFATHNDTDHHHHDKEKKNTVVAKTGGQAGVTRSISECIRISNDKSSSTMHGIYIVDSPGVGLPGRINNCQRMLTLSLAGCIKDNLIDPIIQADYLLYLINLQQQLTGKKRNSHELYPGSIQNPTNNVYEVLKRLKGKANINDNSMAMSWVDNWRQSRKGIIFDPELLLECDEFSLKDYLGNESKKIRTLYSDGMLNTTTTTTTTAANNNNNDNNGAKSKKKKKDKKVSSNNNNKLFIN